MPASSTLRSISRDRQRDTAGGKGFCSLVLVSSLGRPWQFAASPVSCTALPHQQLLEREAPATCETAPRSCPYSAQQPAGPSGQQLSLALGLRQRASSETLPMGQLSPVPKGDFWQAPECRFPASSRHSIAVTSVIYSKPQLALTLHYDLNLSPGGGRCLKS